MDELFSFKELYDLVIKANSPIWINNREIKKGETIAAFDSITLGNFAEVIGQVAAEGGYQNAPRVIWESQKEINLYFKNGVFSKMQLALMTNSNLLDPSSEKVNINKREKVVSNIDGIIEFSEIPLKDYRFIYNENREPFEIIEEIDEKTIKTDRPMNSFLLDYYYEYNKSFSKITVGRQLFSQFVSIEAKTKTKEDEEGVVRSAIIKIPKVKILTDFNISLGDVSPVVGVLNAVALPLEENGKRKTLEIFFLDDELDK